jgi:hypothetical protein
MAMTLGSSIVEGATTCTWIPRQGGSTVRTLTGNQNDIQAKVIELQGQGYSTDVQSGHVWKRTLIGMVLTVPGLTVLKDALR